MKRYWIFIAMFFAGIVAAPQADAAMVLMDGQACLEAPAGEASVQVSVILQNASEELSYTYEELTVLYDDGLVLIEDVSETQCRVTVMAADGNPVISILLENF